VREEHIFTLSEQLNQAYTLLGEQASIVEEVAIDAVLSLDEVNSRLIQELNQLAPFGTGNHKPLFAFPGVTPRKVEQFGKSKEHLKLTFETLSGTREAIAFFTVPEDFEKTPLPGNACTVLGHVEQSHFMNRPQIRLRIVDVI
jgi:single-stranded-DNA-specific exonuclease